MMKGYIQIYTGNGKGKTTAAFGLALRAAGAGQRVFIGQFVKGKTYSEIEAVRKHLPEIEIEQFGRGCFIVDAPQQEDIDLARQGLKRMADILKAGRYDVVVLDEVFIAIYFKLFSSVDLIQAVKGRAEHTEVILTGRYAPHEILDMADLVTEMKEIRHYYNTGVQARKGIEH